MATQRISATSVRDFVGTDGKARYQIAPGHYALGSPALMEDIQAGLVSFVEFDPEQFTTAKAKDDSELKISKMTRVDSPKMKWNQLAGTENVRITNMQDVKTANEIVESAFS